MAISVYQINQKLLSLLTLFSLLSLSHGRLNLDPSDSAALSAVIQALGLSTPSGSTPCSIPGVFCERRLFDDTTYVLRVTRLIFKSRGLTGVVSPAIGHLSELKELSLSNNNLVDHIPTQVCDCKKLEILDLASNQFNGEVPANISSLVRLRFLDLSSNQLSGNLNFLTYFPNLESLSLANNLFSGKVPQSVRSFRNLRFFDFTENLLEEPVPLMDRVEAGKSSQYPKRFMLADSRNGGPARAPRPSKASSSGPTQAPSSSTSHHKHKNKKKKALAWILGFAVGAFAGSFTGFVFSVLLKLALSAVRGRRKDSGMAIFSPLIKKPEDLSFLEKEEGVASLEVIGKGGCGEVYKAQLPGENGRMIAIKKVLQPPKEAAELAEEDSKLLHKKMRQIRSEINTVGQIRHRNLLPLLAHIPRPDCHYLVYEFMKNGSLQDVLNQVRAGARELDWAARHKIALGVAAGLEYLHKHHSPPIVHRDLKPANVLLDDDMEARIADFGLAKAMPDAKTHFTTSNVAGTVGYIAPEYHQTLKFTDRCDIFSFGVLLGVLVVGKLPSDEFFQHTEEMNMVKWMRNVMSSDNPTRAIDEKLIGNGKEEQMLLFLKIACFCTLDNPKERPDSKNVRLMLSQIQP